MSTLEAKAPLQETMRWSLQLQPQLQQQPLIGESVRTIDAQPLLRRRLALQCRYPDIGACCISPVLHPRIVQPSLGNCRLREQCMHPYDLLVRTTHRERHRLGDELVERLQGCDDGSLRDVLRRVPAVMGSGVLLDQRRAACALLVRQQETPGTETTDMMLSRQLRGEDWKVATCQCPAGTKQRGATPRRPPSASAPPSSQPPERAAALV